MEWLHALWTFVLEHPLPLVAALINFIWVYLEYRASIWLWPVGILLPLLYIVVSWQERVYGNLVINVYYLITSIIGWVVWLRSKGQDERELPITTTPTRVAVWGTLSVLLLSWPAYWLLSSYTDSALPWADALATVWAFAGMIMLARKWREHWVCWIISNFLYAIVFYTSGDAITTFVMLVNLCVALMGYRHWGRLQRQQAHE